MTTQQEIYTLYAEFTSGNSNKFYRVTANGNQLTCHWGRIGTAGQMRVKDFASHRQARVNASSKMAEKTAKGYVITQDPRQPQPPTPVEETPTVRHREGRRRTPEPAPVKRVEPVANGSANVVFFLD